MKKIIFICTGNTCRSPMAEAIMKKLSEKKTDLDICSRGLYVLSSSPASKNSIDALKQKYDIDLTNHTSKQLSKEDVEKADLILCMTKSHSNFIKENFIDYKDKVYTLHEYTDKTQKDISDPFGGNIDLYIECCIEIYKCIEILNKKI